MERSLVTGPEVEPVSLEEAKTHLKIVDQTEEDTTISGLIVAARLWVEEYLRRPLIQQSWDFFLDEFPEDGEIVLPLPPTTLISGVFYTDSNGSEQTWSNSEYSVFLPSGPAAGHAKITLKSAHAWPTTNGEKRSIRIRAQCGYGPTSASVPESIRAAIKMIVATMHENPQDVVTGTIATKIPIGSENLLSMFRVFEFE